MKGWRTVFFKELRDVTRDRRTLTFMLLLPTVSIPLVLWATTSLMTHFARKLAREEAPVLVLNPQASPQLVQAVEGKGGLPRKAAALEGVLQQLGLSSEELALVSKEPQAFLALLRRKNISPDTLAQSLLQAGGLEDVDPTPASLLEMLQIPNIRLLTRPPPGLEELLRLEGEALQVALAEAVRRQKLAAAVYLEPEAEKLLAGEQAARVVIYYLEASDRSTAALRGLQRILRSVSQNITAERIERRALPANFASPLKVKPERLPGPGILVKLLSQLLPYMILIFSMLGALYPAIDVSAGEKERGTLETLLSAPVGRTELVLGKFAVVLAAAVVAAVLATLSLAVSLSLGVFSEIELISESAFSFKAGQAVLALLIILPMAAIFSALLLAISVFARSFKEAQSYSSPLQMLLILPAFASFIPGVELDWLTSSIPVVNVSLALKEIFTGNTDQHVGHLLLIFLSSALLAGLLIAFSVWWFRQEKVLFRQ